MPDYTPDFFTDERDPGYYKVTYGGDPAPAGPFEDVPAMAAALDLTDYPGDGYIVTWEPVTGELGSVPSLNPDDLALPEHPDPHDELLARVPELARERDGAKARLYAIPGDPSALDELFRLSDEAMGLLAELALRVGHDRAQPPASEPWHLVAPRRISRGHQRLSWTLTFDHEADCWYWLERLDVLGDDGRWEDHGTEGMDLGERFMETCCPTTDDYERLSALCTDGSAVALRQLAPFVARMLDLPGVEFRRDGDRFTIHPAPAVGA